MNATTLLPAGHPDGPEGWPTIRNIGSEADLRPGETLFTDKELVTHIAALRPAFDAWQAAQTEARTNARFILPAELLLIDRMTNAEFLAFSTSNVAAIAKAWVILNINGQWSPGQRGSGRLRNALTTLFGDVRSAELLAKPTRAERTEYELED